MMKLCTQTALSFPTNEEFLNLPAGVCPVYRALEIAESSMKSSCGQGTFCRDGLKQLYLLIKDITDGKGTTEDVALLEELCATMSLVHECDMSDRAIALIGLFLREHSGEWMAHVLRRRCKAGVCPGYPKVSPTALSGEGRRRRAAAASNASAPTVSIPTPVVSSQEETLLPPVPASKLTLQTDGIRRRCRKGGIIAIIED